MNTLRKAGRVKRYHTVDTIGHQTVAEHSFNVCLILLALFQGKVSSELLKAALYHDLPEIVTGDVPATAKWGNPELRDALRKVEDRFEATHSLTVDLSEEELTALKWADMMELVQYCVDQLEMGNRNMLVVATRGVDYLCSMPSINNVSEMLLVNVQYELRKHYEGE